MTRISITSLKASSPRRLTALALLAAGALILPSCGTTRPDHTVTTSSVPDDYRTRHPITLAEVEHTLDVPIAAGDQRLLPATRDLIRGFAQDFGSLSSGTMQVELPDNAANSGAAIAVRNQVRQVLIDAGVPNRRVVMSRYASAAPEASAPIRLRFVAVTAVTDDCGQWPSDLFGKTMIDNKNWENFGCASQQNLAAQIANPADLVGPRGMTPIDAQRRANVISVYRAGSTSTE